MVESFRSKRPERLRVRPLILEPARFGVIVGALLAIIGTLMPWATGVDHAGASVSFSPFTDADGGLVVVLAIAASVLVLSRSVAESRTRTLHASTIVVGVVAVLNWSSAVRAGAPAFVDGDQVLWVRQPEPGLFIAGIGVALLAIGGSRIGVVSWRDNGTLSDPLDVVVTRRMVVNGLIQTGFGVGGFIVGLSAVVVAFGPYAILFMIFGGLGAGAAGLKIGERISSRGSR
jgi:hypothetical protein